MRKILAKAAAVSSLVALLVTLGSSILFARTTTYASGLGAKELEDLKYFEAVALMESRAEQAFGLGAFLENATSLWFWQNFLVSWAILASICFACCVLLTRWARG